MIRNTKYATYVSLILFALAVFLRLLPGERLVDDAYITFRYARNLINGLGFVYNPGERVLGTSTPLYTLLLAGLSLLFRTGNFPALSIWLNALADGLNCALLLPLGEAISGRRRVGIAAGFLYALAPYSVTFAIGGMETSVFVLLLILTALFYLQGQMIWAFTASLALLTRPDALIFIGPIALDYAVRWLLSLRSLGVFRISYHISHTPGYAIRDTDYGLRITDYSCLKLILLFLAPLLPWLIFAAFYFGSPIPQSIAAKTAAYQLTPEAGLVRLWQHYSTPFFENVALEKSPLGAIRVPLGDAGIPLANFWPLPGIILYLFLYLIGWRSFIKRDTRAIALGAYPLLYFAAFALANPLIFRWYLTPPLPFYFLLLLTGLSTILTASQDEGQRMTDERRKTIDAIVLRLSSIVHPFTAICLFFALLTASAWTLTPDHGPQRPAPEMAWFKLEEIYTQIGRELGPAAEPETVIAAGDIGALGYFSNARILDTLGLVSPPASAYYPLPADQLIINYAISAELIIDQQPDYVVFLEVYGRRTLLTAPRFLADYTLREKIPTDIYGSDGLLIYQATASKPTQ